MLLLSCLYYYFKWKCFFYRLCMLGLVVVDYFMMIFKCCILKKRWLFVVVVDWEDLSIYIVICRVVWCLELMLL